MLVEEATLPPSFAECWTWTWNYCLTQIHHFIFEICPL